MEFLISNGAVKGQSRRDSRRDSRADSIDLSSFTDSNRKKSVLELLVNKGIERHTSG